MHTSVRLRSDCLLAPGITLPHHREARTHTESVGPRGRGLTGWASRTAPARAMAGTAKLKSMVESRHGGKVVGKECRTQVGTGLGVRRRTRGEDTGGRSVGEDGEDRGWRSVSTMSTALESIKESVVRMERWRELQRGQRTKRTRASSRSATTSRQDDDAH